MAYLSFLLRMDNHHHTLGGFFMEFTKMHGLGNDYIFINTIHSIPERLPELAIALSHRHFGIGGDGLICVGSSKLADFSMIMYNADGSQGEMCGNGIRCVGKYLYDQGLTQKTTLTIETKAGIKTLFLQISQGKIATITVDMGIPTVQWMDTLSFDCGIYEITAISMGNPHAVLFTSSLENSPLKEVAIALAQHPKFPQGVNVEMAQVLSPTHIKMRVWERGSGETMACGTGACAVLVAGVINGLCQRQVAVSLLGGDLSIRWGADGHIYMEGPAETVFSGSW